MNAGVEQKNAPFASGRDRGTAIDRNCAKFITPELASACQNAPMPSTDTASSPSNRQDRRQMQDATSFARRASTNQQPEAANRFGAAASIIDRLDLRPLHMRQRRPWWRLW